MKKRLCIAPFTIREYPLLSYLSEIYSIIALVSPKGIGREGEDIAVLRNRAETGYRFCNSVEEGIRDADTVLISEVLPQKENLYGFARRARQLAEGEGKEILSFLETGAMAGETDAPDSVAFETEAAGQGADSEEGEKTVFHKFSVPVIYISEMINGCEGYDVFLKLTKRLRSDGRRVLAVSQDCYNSLFGQHTLRFWKASEPQKMVYEVNREIHRLARRERPDIILIRLPEPVMKYDDDNPFDFGLTAFLVSQAVPGDGCICCSYMGTPSMDFWENINSHYLSKFGYPIIGVHISNQRVDVTEERKLAVIRFPYERVGKTVELLNRNSSLSFYDFSSEKDFENFYRAASKEWFEMPYGVISV